MPNPVEAVKQAAVEAVDASNPVNVLFGTVLSSSPLKIQVDQKSTYTGKMLVLSRNVTNFSVSMTVNHTTEPASGGTGEAAFEEHSHEYTGTKTFQVHNGLRSGERVVLVRIQGGKRFLVWDRVIE